MKKIRLSHFVAAMMFACAAVLYYRLLEFRIFCIVLLCFAIRYFFYPVLTEAGIEHKFLGIRYRLTRWDEIKDVMRVPSGTYPFRVLVVTTTRGTVRRPNQYGIVKGRKVLSELCSGKTFSIECDNTGRRREVIPYVREHYGALNYDFFANKHR